MLLRTNAVKDGAQGDRNPRGGGWAGLGRRGPLPVPFDASQTMKLALTDLASGVAVAATATATYGTSNV